MSQVTAAYTAAAALTARGRKLAVTANNIANVNTDEFKKSRAVLQAGASPSISVTISEVNTPGTMQPNGLESSNVDIAEEFVDLITTQHSYTANAKTIQTEDAMQKSLLDIFV